MSDAAVHPNTIIIGAGPSGLAVGACLKKAGIESLLLEQNDHVGSAWYGHYERLHLHTDKGNSKLPFHSFGKEIGRYPSRLEVIAYLEAYVQKFQLEPKFGERVVEAEAGDRGWVVMTENGRFQAPNLVIATGYTREPNIPDWPGKASFQGEILHSGDYRNGRPFKDKRVLVVGFGNSGGEIAIDLWEHGAIPTLSVRRPVNVIPRELLGMPILAIGIVQNKLPARVADILTAPILRLAVGDLTRYGLPKLPYGPATQIAQDKRIPLIDVGTIKLIKEGKVAVCAGVESFTETGVVFSGGQGQDFEAVILATGFRPQANGFLKGVSAVLDEDGTPLESGRSTPIPGLYFCGFYVSPTGMLREIAIEARQIAASIASR